MKWSEPLPENVRDSRLIKENGRYYVCIPHTNAPIAINADNQGQRVVALDPGVRTFISFFSEDSCGKIGDGDFTQVFKLCLSIDKMISILSKTKDVLKRFRLKSAIGRAKWKIHDLIDELHFKTAMFFVQNFDVILLPTFEVSQMVRRDRRKIRSKTVRSMLSLAHYKFKLRIKQKAKEFGKIVLDVNEAFTSKTVSWTGEIVEKLGVRKNIKSKLNGLVMDRDINGARGIMLRAMGDTPIIN